MSPLGYNTEVIYPPLAYEARRRRFVQGIQSLAGVKPVACYLPHPSDNLTSIDPISGRVWTADATMNGQVKPRGSGYSRTFNGTTNYLTTPDTANLSFVEPIAMSWFVVANTVDTATFRTFFSKDAVASAQAEYYVYLDATTDALGISVADPSAAATDSRVGTAAATMGSWQAFGGSYTGAGGATAMNNMTLYQAGAVATSTASNNAAYVAMEDGTAALNVGADTGHTADFMSGSLALVLLVAANLSAAAQAQLSQMAKTYFAI